MEGILDDGGFFTKDATGFKLATNVTRFGSFFIDYIIITIIQGVALFGILLLMNLSFDEIDHIGPLVEYGSSFTIYILYYVLWEFFNGGKTPGKFLTKTRAVTISNERMGFKTTLLRSISRCFPFEQFSFFSEKPGGWHDRWTVTMVIKE